MEDEDKSGTKYFPKNNLNKRYNKFFILWLLATLILSLAVFYIIIVGVGLYFLGWRMNFVKRTARVIPYPAAWVNIFPILFGEVFKEEAHTMRFYQQTASSLPQEKVLEKNTLELLVKYKLLQKLSSEYHLSVSPSELRDTLKKLYEENGGQKSFEEILYQFYGYTPSEINNLVYLSLMQGKLTSYFEDNILKKVHLAHILVEDEGKAKKIFERAKKEDFSKLAKEFSKDKDTKDKGGDLGFFAYEDLGEVIVKGESLDRKLYSDFRKKIWSAKDSDIFLFHTDRGWQIIKVLGFKGTEEKNLDEWFQDKVKKTKIWYLVKY